jgi:hypothetical protein
MEIVDIPVRETKTVVWRIRDISPEELNRVAIDYDYDYQSASQFRYCLEDLIDHYHMTRHDFM